LKANGRKVQKLEKKQKRNPSIDVMGMKSYFIFKNVGKK
jgi:hypothetical protein